MASFDEAPPGNPKAGEKFFRTKCSQCHTVDKGAGHKQGNQEQRQGIPTLLLKNMAVMWEEKTLYDYLLNPKKYIHGTKMVFSGLKKPQDLAYLIAYLKEGTA